MNKTEKTRKEVARILGEKDVQILDTKWLEKMEQGVIITIHIRRWRARAKLTFEDLGLPPVQKKEAEVLEELLLLGEKFLLPARYVRALESADSSARKYLNRVAYQTSYGAFVPFTEYAEVKAELGEYRDRYLATGADIAENLDRIKREHLENCSVAARDAYQRLSKLTPRFKRSAKYLDEDQFVEIFLKNISNLVPSQEYVGASFSFDIDVSYIPLPSLVARDMADAKRIQAETEAEKTVILAEGRVKAAEVDAERERIWAQRKLEQLHEEQALSVEEAAIRDREKKLAQMNRDVIEQARKQKEEMVGSFMMDLLVQLRGLVYETTTDVLGSLTGNKQVNKRSVGQLKNLIEQIDRLNYFGDTEIDQMIMAVKAQFTNLVEDVSPEDIQKCLQDIAILTRSSLLDLGETPRSARGLGIPDVPSVTLVRRSRQSLGLDDIDVDELDMSNRTNRSL